MIHTITVTLPEGVYEQLEAQAQTAARSVEDVVAETLARTPPTCSRAGFAARCPGRAESDGAAIRRSALDNGLQHCERR
jgi:hypothetical protein